ncbi:carboxypeptidase regulatory-like domain-containing protein [Mongoliibacter ruber]|uniref:Carboxypeptidase family protein n=1 Tax=Mongoliibacter ruber TaxID=1750599 RepID=A0A2T0WJT3_9BACT|nr:carboxypeptidase regulatory-like domain-containing protein [Mongoliibacter ruber]PRY86956.1 carboxypeptidase family protein [Mongoliibacter ruber]
MKKSFLVNLVFLAFLLLGCEDIKLDIDRFGSISGVIVDGETYEPLEGVLVATTPASSTVLTNENGEFSFSRVQSGDVSISARKKDFLNGNVSVAVFEGENTNLTFFMLKDERNVGNVLIFDPVPGNTAIDQPLNVTFRWSVEQQNRGQQLEYTVFIFESGSTTQTVLGENLVNREVTASNLKSNTTYFWYVVARFEGRNVANSPTWSFRTRN